MRTLQISCTEEMHIAMKTWEEKVRDENPLFPEITGCYCQLLIKTQPSLFYTMF